MPAQLTVDAMTLSLVRPLEPAADDDDRFLDLFRSYHRRLHRLAASRFPALDSEDIAQEAMLRVLVNIERLDPRRDPWPYLATVCLNIGRDLVQRAARESRSDVAISDEPSSPAAEDAVLAGLEQCWVDEVLSCLPALPRRVLALHALEDMTTAEVAHLLGRTENAVRQLLFRARRDARCLLSAGPAPMAIRPGAVAADGT